MTKKDLIELVAQKAKLSKKATKQVIETFLDEIMKALANGEVVKLSGFGTFKTKMFKAKVIKAIGTKISKKIAARRMPRYIPGTKVKKMVR
ncbi:HU family DNA-binding protein [Patescibacteria group bacterium]|nr:HU family DNA-binding protein [Patescibacteria group bacterium]MCG2702400.1 HU family DNA-binding protein [Candidatus Parcubacteria bacterium]MBU4264829.1 HU family DNA-binding protein [Patescibacteria group bacterium]MBU4389700.1 HU family DNA-binding protein [Patescibacteria group bacterium]MBU4397395.1 HU family DNA-binding protein [Patescibacteria group bacterium]